jgi:hypothetical protein
LPEPHRRVRGQCEARRLGARGPLPLAFLEHAAVGYLSPKECLALDRQTWFDDALAWARTPVKGVVSCLRGVLAHDGIGEAADLVDLSDIIEQQIAPERWGINPLGTLWQAAQREPADGRDLEALALRAFASARSASPGTSTSPPSTAKPPPPSKACASPTPRPTASVPGEA